MKAAAKPTKASARKACRGVPLDEMRRLMRVYGSTKCLRKRQSSAGDEAKAESVRRRFYRWFPDLDERFVKDAAGHYRPRHGHEFEMSYREELRRKDRESLGQKRSRGLRRRKSVAGDDGSAQEEEVPLKPADGALAPSAVSDSIALGFHPMPQSSMAEAEYAEALEEDVIECLLNVAEAEEGSRGPVGARDVSCAPPASRDAGSSGDGPSNPCAIVEGTFRECCEEIFRGDGDVLSHYEYLSDMIAS